MKKQTIVIALVLRTFCLNYWFFGQASRVTDRLKEIPPYTKSKLPPQFRNLLSWRTFQTKGSQLL